MARMTRRSSMPWEPAVRRWNGCAAGSPPMGSMPRSRTNPSRVVLVLSPPRRRPTSSPSPAPMPRTGTTTGRSGCWARRWSSSATSSPSPQKRSGRSWKKNELKPWRHEEWCLPRVGGAFVAAMEDVLDLYAEAYVPSRPVVCLDEKSVTLHADIAPPLPVRPGSPARADYEYVRCGTANLFVCIEPLRGYRHITVTDRRTKQDYAQVIKWLVDEAYPEVEVIRLVQDNLNTHLPGSLYDTFEPAEARRLLRKLEVHYTPVHGSWLNMAEIEIAVVGRACLRRRAGDRATLERHLAALETERNGQHRTITWSFSAYDARTTLRRLYPIPQN